MPRQQNIENVGNLNFSLNLCERKTSKIFFMQQNINFIADSQSKVNKLLDS